MVIKEILDKIKRYESIIIHRHVRPDPDAYGSQVGLAEIIKSSFPNKQVYVVGDSDGSLDFLAQMDQVSDEVYQGALAIICDTANRERISDQRYKLAEEIIKIDHHPEVDIYGDVVWINTQSSSTSEMIYELFVYGKDTGMLITDRAAKLLYAGIIGDTGRFLFPSTTNVTFRYASELASYDFDRTQLYEDLYKTSENIAHLKGYILQNFSVSPNGVSAIKITKDILEKYNLTSEQTSKLVGVLGDVEGIYTWVIFVEEEDLIRVRLRSKGPAIHEIAAKFNGGGHPLASGATIYDWKETENVIAELEKACQNHYQTDN
ncbi:bifunctional oligoribonuclease and PAP phosphatase NrnA [Paraliobacillus quinghaiensis]|uniref:Bifunctional oligoribonuclease and PAP phosphatase NrnA n=1 Tax=Paraliobacillus quinghaiensis TaxID=470815 RepID=A0A917TKC8_9BACI|nr:bifunctional oligoribonuclease/PAP phosphatase NrnA [Paraliobacillus quinghaiensis]GGM26596.1 bifunctional oligoribonuclease and PAP phosphatase NrnA [Paraliobacillus quinghaiensis]